MLDSHNISFSILYNTFIVYTCIYIILCFPFAFSRTHSVSVFPPNDFLLFERVVLLMVVNSPFKTNVGAIVLEFAVNCFVNTIIQFNAAHCFSASCLFRFFFSFFISLLCFFFCFQQNKFPISFRWMCIVNIQHDDTVRLILEYYYWYKCAFSLEIPIVEMRILFTRREYSKFFGV